jgi:hypothetical protein
LSKALIVGAVVVTLMQVVIASNSPIRDASMIGAAVLFLVVLWDELFRETSAVDAERPSPREVGSIREGKA